MPKEIILNAPFNSVSFGQVTYNIAKALFEKGVTATILPMYDNRDISAYNPSAEFKAWLNDGFARGIKKFSRKTPSLKIWHLSGSEYRVADRQVLYTFHETDSPTEEEVNIVNQQDFTFFSSNFSRENFENFGATNVGNVGLGFDPEIIPASGRVMSKAITHWILIGKWEARKNTAMIIKSWVEKYGNNPAHALTLLVFNPILHRMDQNAHERNFSYVFSGKKIPFNVSIHNPYRTNLEVSQLYNSADIDLSGFSNAEGWGLPAFNATALGKWSIVTDCTAHKDWATKENSILVSPIGKQPCYDKVHFAPNLPFNQGNFYLFTQDQLSKAMDSAVEKKKILNSEGVKLREQFTYSKTVEKILEKLV